MWSTLKQYFVAFIAVFLLSDGMAGVIVTTDDGQIINTKKHPDRAKEIWASREAELKELVDPKAVDAVIYFNSLPGKERERIGKHTETMHYYDCLRLMGQYNTYLSKGKNMHAAYYNKLINELHSRGQGCAEAVSAYKQAKRESLETMKNEELARKEEVINIEESNTEILQEALDIEAQIKSLDSSVQSYIQSTPCDYIYKTKAFVDSPNPDEKRTLLTEIEKGIAECPPILDKAVGDYKRKQKIEELTQRADIRANQLASISKNIQFVENELGEKSVEDHRRKIDQICHSVRRYQQSPKVGTLLLNDENLSECESEIASLKTSLADLEEKAIKKKTDREIVERRERKEAKHPDSEYVIKKGELFCTSKSRLEVQWQWLSEDRMEFAPGCFSTAAEIPVEVVDWGFTVKGVRGIENGQMYWIATESLR